MLGSRKSLQPVLPTAPGRGWPANNSTAASQTGYQLLQRNTKVQTRDPSTASICLEPGFTFSLQWSHWQAESPHSQTFENHSRDIKTLELEPKWEDIGQDRASKNHARDTRPALLPRCTSQLSHSSAAAWLPYPQPWLGSHTPLYQTSFTLSNSIFHLFIRSSEYGLMKLAAVWPSVALYMITQ